MKKYLSLAVSVFVFMSFGISDCYPQGSAAKKDADEKDKQELERFYSEFAKSFAAYRDFDKMPAELFAPDFKSILARNDEWIRNVLSPEVNNRLTEPERYENNVVIVNLITLLMKTVFHKVEDYEISNVNGENVRKILLPATVRLIENSHWFKWLLNDKLEKLKPETKGEWRDFINDAKKISDALIHELDQVSPAEKVKYERNFDKFHRETNNFAGEECAGENCAGVPENTKIYSVLFFLSVVRVARIEGRFKVLNLYPLRIFN
jgi:hypothetical protein